MTQWDVSTGTFGATARLIVEKKSQDVAANTSSVRVRLQILDVPTVTNRGDPVACTIDGLGATYNTTFTWASGTVAKTIADITRTVTHDPDGTLTLEITGSFAATGTAGLGGPTTNGPRTFVLTPIPRIPYAFLRWDGAAEVHCTEAVRWDGAAEVALTEAVRWDGVAEVSLL